LDKTNKESKDTKDTAVAHVDLGARLLPGDWPGAPDLARALELIGWAAAHRICTVGVRCRLTAEGELPGYSSERLKHLREGARTLGHDVTFFTAPVVELRLVRDSMVGRLRELALGPHRLLLVELPETRDLKGAARVVRTLTFNGFVPVVVAPERNPEVRRLPELLRYVLQVGAICCGDAGCAAGLEGHGRAVTARRLWSLGYYSFFSGFIRGQEQPVAPSDLAAVLGTVPPSWREPQGQSIGLTTRAARLLGPRPSWSFGGEKT